MSRDLLSSFFSFLAVCEMGPRGMLGGLLIPSGFSAIALDDIRRVGGKGSIQRRGEFGFQIKKGRREDLVLSFLSVY